METRISLNALQELLPDISNLESQFNIRYKAYLLSNPEGRTLAEAWLTTVVKFRESLRRAMEYSKSVKSDLRLIVSSATLLNSKLDLDQDVSRHVEDLVHYANIISTSKGFLQSELITSQGLFEKIQTDYNQLKMFSNNMLKDFNAGDIK